MKKSDSEFEFGGLTTLEAEIWNVRCFVAHRQTFPGGTVVWLHDMDGEMSIADLARYKCFEANREAYLQNFLKWEIL